MSGRGYVITPGTTLVTEECCKCGVLFAMPDQLQDQLFENRQTFYCVNGHPQHYVGTTAAEKARAAEARASHLEDQLRASEIEREHIRARLLRDRHRVANGVCPCCNRSFPALGRHMRSQHPGFDVSAVKAREPRYRCSCGRDFDTPRGLAVHQGHSRSSDWMDPSVSKWRRHLTEVTSR